MDKKTLIRKLDDGIASLRGLLGENEGSALKTIASSAKQGLDSLKEAFEHNEKAQKAVDGIKKQCQELEEAITKGDKKLSAKLLSTAEKKLSAYKKKFESEPKEKAAPKPAKPAKRTVTAQKAAKSPAKIPAETAKPAAKPKKASPAGKTNAKPAKKQS